MGDIVNKFKIYDVLGIWLTGIISLAYYLIATIIMFNYDFWGLLKSFNSDYSILFIFMFLIIAYLFGTVEHEIGKWIADGSKKYNVKNITDVKTKCLIHHKSVDNFNERIEQLNNNAFYKRDKGKTTFDEANSYFKHLGKTDLIDRYHSFYGFSRGLFVGFVFYTAFCLALLLANLICNINLNIIIISITLVLTIFLTLLFAVRTYRTYLEWVKNVFIQYYKHREAESKKSSDNQSE